MNIKGSGKNAIASELLANLAVKQQSGETISQTEVKSALNDLRADLKDEFEHSARGLANAGRAIENTLNLAVESGWIKGEKAAQILEDFLGDGDGSLKDLMSDIRKDTRSRRPARSSYSSYTPTPRRTYTPSRPTPRRTSGT